MVLIRQRQPYGYLQNLQRLALAESVNKGWLAHEAEIRKLNRSTPACILYHDSIFRCTSVLTDEDNRTEQRPWSHAMNETEGTAFLKRARYEASDQQQDRQ